MSASADRNLLFGILAVQLDFVTEDALIAGIRAWLPNKVKPLTDVFADEGLLSAEALTNLAALVDAQLKRHGNDPRQCLAALPPIAPALIPRLAALPDEDVRQAIAFVATAHATSRSPEPDHRRTVSRRHSAASTENWATASPRDGAVSPSQLTQDALDQATGPGTANETLIDLPRIAGFEILSELGRGGMGVVFLARELALNRVVALKMILAGGLARADDKARFLAEAEAVAALHHPGIVQIHEFGTCEGRPYFALEFCPGGTLAKKLTATPMVPDEAAALVERLARAVHAAHEKGIVHRDLKPSNVLLAADGAPKVTDFGLAKRIEGGETLTQSGAIVGTPSYMAPEQALGKGKEARPAADVYALGAILYECLTGRPPFKAATEVDTIMQVVSDDPISVRQLQPKAPRDLETVALKCLAKDPDRRYVSAAELADDLGRYLRREPITAQPTGQFERAMKWARRRPAAAALLVAIMCGIVGTTRGFIRADGQRQIADREARHAATVRDEAEARARAETRAKDEARAETSRAEREKSRADEKAEEVRRALYAARQQVAMNAWRENRADTFTDVVARQKPAAGERDLRGFEWAYLDRLARSPGKRWQSAGPMVNGVALTPDERTAITVGFDGQATAWEVATGRKLWDTGVGLRWSVNAAAISPDGRTVALAGHLGQLQLWGIDGTFRAKLDGHRAQVFGVAFSPDGSTLASASADVTVRLWDAAKGTALGMLGSPPEPDGGRPGPQMIGRADPALSTGHTDMVWQAAWSPDGKRLASCSTDGSIKIWSVLDRKLLRTLIGHDGIVVAVKWAPDGQTVAGVSRPLVGAAGGEVKLWNPDTGRVEATFRPPTGGLHAIAFTPDGLEVVTGGQDRTVRVWRKDGRLVAEHRGFHGDVVGLAVGGGGQWAVAGTRAGEIVAFALGAAPGRRSTPVYDGTRLAVTADGRIAAFRDGAIRWHDPESLTEIANWSAVTVPEPKTGEKVISNAVAFALRPDGEAAHGGHSYVGPGTVVWQTADGKVRHLLSGHSAPITAVAFLPRDRLASADQSGEVRVWSGVTGRVVATARPWDGPIRALAATSGERLWAGGVPWEPGSDTGQHNRPTAKEGRLARIEGNRVVWDTQTPAAVSAAAPSSDGRRLVVGLDNGVLIWLDGQSGAEVRRRAVLSGGAVAVQFSPSEPRIAVGGADGSVRVLDSDSGEELLVLNGPTEGPAAGLAFFPDGRRLVAANGGPLSAGAIVVWDGRPATEDWPPLPTIDAAWHKARLAMAGGRDVPFSPRQRDVFAMRYHLERLCALEPAKLDWPRNLLALDQDAGDSRAAANRLDSIVGRWPNDAPMWYDLGNARRELGDSAGAEAAFRKCIALNPKMPEAHCNLGLLLGLEGRFAEALEFIARGHDLGTAGAKVGKPWPYPSAQWLDRQKRLGQLAAKFGQAKDISDVPDAERPDLVEVLTLTKRPLAAVRLADPKADVSPGPVVIGAALRCGEGIGDADSLPAAERAAWREKALAWLRLDFDSLRAESPAERARQCEGMRNHPLFQIARPDRIEAWPPTEREAWRHFWTELDDTNGRLNMP